ncbi:MAG: GAF domain-containing protein [Geitlerinemataceae cyanobacterium]
MWHILDTLVSSNRYMPHGNCYLWQTPLVGLHAMSDLLIAIAYFSIPIMLVYFVCKRQDVPFLNVFLLFGAFIILCGVGHLLEIWTLWYPTYWISGIEQAVTALVSCYTAVELATVIPQFLSLKTPEQLEAINQELENEIDRRREAEAELRRANDELDLRVQARTTDLEREIRVRIAAESALRDSDTRLREQQVGLLKLATRESLQESTFEATLAEITELASEVLKAERSSIWLYDRDGCSLKCMDLYQRTGDRHSEGMKLSATHYPSYFQALKNQRVIAIDDAVEDPRTIEFRDTYLLPHQITAMLDAPINLKGRIVGVICIEHTQTPRHWAIEEQNFVTYLAYMTALAIESRDRSLAEEALRESEAKLYGILQNMPVMLNAVDADGKFIFWNHESELVTGYLAEEVIGNPLGLALIYVDDDYRSQMEAAWQERGNDFRNWEWIITCKDGSQKTIAWSNIADRFPIEGWSAWGTGVDVSARKRAETTLRQTADREKTIARVIQRMRQTLDLDAIFAATTQELRQALNCDRVLVYRFNPDWSGQLIAESVARGWQSVVGNLSQPPLNQIIVGRADCTVTAIQVGENLLPDTYLQETEGGIYRNKCNYRYVWDIYKAGFDPCYLEFLERLQARAYLIVPIFCGTQLWGLLAAYQNSQPRNWGDVEIAIATQVGTQLGVAVQQAQLFAQTQEQATELKVAKDAADAANRAKSEFLANMSHELRTPLNAILGFSQLINRDSTLSPDNRAYVKTVNRSGEHLLALINDILEMSKIEAGRITLNENDFDLHSLLDDLKVMLQIKADAKGLQLLFEISSEVPRFVRADESKLRQVLINLIGNAIKFTTRGGVTLRVSSTMSSPMDDASLANSAFPTNDPGGMILGFEVEDTGLGIAPQEMDKLFQAFAQTATGLQSQEGTGLGLPISQKFVRLMGGEMTVSSEVDRGSLFSFEIPVMQVDTIEGESSSPSASRTAISLAPNQPTYRILVVEDRWENRQLLLKLLTPIGFEVREAVNGLEGIKVWQTWEPQLIWMDMQMPVMDGYEATQRIKAHEKGKDTVVIALTASAFEEQRQEILSIGCDDFVRKPFREAELLEKISQYLGVEYLYAEDVPDQASTAGEEPKTLEASALQVMPAEWIERVHFAASQCSDLLIFESIAQIPPENTALIQGLTELVENFQFDRVMELTQQEDRS